MVGTQTVPRLHHLRDRLVVQIDAVLDRVGAGAHGIPHAGRPVRVDRDLVPSACAASTIAFISSKVIVCVVSTLSKLPRDP